MHASRTSVQPKPSALISVRRPRVVQGGLRQVPEGTGETPDGGGVEEVAVVFEGSGEAALDLGEHQRQLALRPFGLEAPRRHLQAAEAHLDTGLPHQTPGQDMLHRAPRRLQDEHRLTQRRTARIATCLQSFNQQHIII